MTARSSRILPLGLGYVALALAVAAIAPAGLLLLGPLLLGVPHVTADVRYLIVRGPRSLGTPAVIAMMVPLAAMTGLAAMVVSGGQPMPRLALGLGGAAIALVVGLAPGGARRRTIALAIVGLAIVLALAAPVDAMLVLVFGHNLVALAIWWGWTRPTVRPAERAAVLAAVVVGLAVIAAGVLDRGGTIGGGRLFAARFDPVVARRLVIAYAFLQAVHYAVWLRLIPATRPSTAGPLRALAADLGGGLVVIAIAALAVPALAGVADAGRVRDGYLALAFGHVWLELAVLGHLIVAGERLP